ncbi:MAG: hypothetical protein ACTHNU_10210 [Gaiellales bacterium]
MVAHRLRLACACALAVAVPMAAGCGNSSSSPPSGPVIHVSEQDFQIKLSPSVVQPGEISLIDHNKGPDTHELIVVRADGKGLPLRSDGITLNEDALGPRTLGELPGLSPGETRVLRLHLRPGKYVVFCNMLGHYEGGMHAALTVR